MTRPVPGREEEFDRWYREEHLPDLLGVDGVIAAQRFEFATAFGSPGPDHRYLALYEVEADSPEAAIATLTAALREPGRVRSSGSLDRDFRQWYFRPLGERITSDATREEI
jgi:hypothetical protein